MQLAVGLHFGAWLILWLTLMAWVRLSYPNSAPGRVLGVLTV